MREVLKSAEEAARSRERLSLLDEDDEGDASVPNGGRESASRPTSATSVRRGWEDIPDKVEEEAMEKAMLKRMELARQSAMNLQVDLTVLSLDGRGSNTAHDVRRYSR